MPCMGDEDRTQFATTQHLDMAPELRKALRKPHTLHQVGGPGAPRDILLSADRTVIGRSREADVAVDSPRVSRSHAVIEKTPEGFTCRDLDSANGTFVQGVRVSAAALRDLDVVQLGDAVFEYRVG